MGLLRDYWNKIRGAGETGNTPAAPVRSMAAKRKKKKKRTEVMAGSYSKTHRRGYEAMLEEANKP